MAALMSTSEGKTGLSWPRFGRALCCARGPRPHIHPLQRQARPGAARPHATPALPSADVPSSPSRDIPLHVRLRLPQTQQQKAARCCREPTKAVDISGASGGRRLAAKCNRQRSACPSPSKRASFLWHRELLYSHFWVSLHLCLLRLVTPCKQEAGLERSHLYRPQPPKPAWAGF